MINAVDRGGQNAAVPSRVRPCELSSRALHACLEAAVAAPSLHNSQPWLFGLRQGSVEVVADRYRRLEVIDPAGRELMISVGAALFNLRVAMLDHHRVPVLRLFPDPDRPDLVARVTPGPRTEPDATVRALAHAIPRRRTNRWPLGAMPLPDSVIEELAAAAAAEGAALAVADQAGRAAIIALTRAADEWQRTEVGYLDELARWTRPDPDRHDGVPPPAFGPRDERDTLPLRDFGLALPELRRVRARFEAAPAIMVLRTEGDDRVAWVRAGQALQRVLLTATVRGVSTTPMTQALEVPGIRRILTDPLLGRHPQVILRLGYGRPVAASPRRPLGEVVLDARPRQ